MGEKHIEKLALLMVVLIFSQYQYNAVLHLTRYMFDILLPNKFYESWVVPGGDWNLAYYGNSSSIVEYQLIYEGEYSGQPAAFIKDSDSNDILIYTDPDFNETEWLINWIANIWLDFFKPKRVG